MKQKVIPVLIDLHDKNGTIKKSEGEKYDRQWTMKQVTLRNDIH